MNSKEHDITLVTVGHQSYLWDEKGQGVDHTGRSDYAILLDIMSRENPDQSPTAQRFVWIPIIMLNDGKVVRTRSYQSDLQNPNGRLRVLTEVGLVPYVDIDPLIQQCFDVGYTMVDVGPSGYGGSFGISCKYDKGKEPQDNGWPPIWRIVEEFDLGGGAGGHHSHQMIHFEPTGKYRFGEHRP